MAGGVSAASAHGSWPRRHPWWATFLVVLGALALAAVLGGFTEREHPLPSAQVDEAVSLGQVDIRIRSAEIAQTDERGKPFSDKLARLLVHASVVNTDDEPGTVSASSDVQVRVDGRTTVKAATGYDAFRTYQPGVPVDIVLPFVLADGATVKDGVEINLRAKSYAWNNKIDVGPTWSGSRFARVVRLPVEGAP